MTLRILGAGPINRSRRQWQLRPRADTGEKRSYDRDADFSDLRTCSGCKCRKPRFKLACAETETRQCSEFPHSGHPGAKISADFKPPIRRASHGRGRRRMRSESSSTAARFALRSSLRPAGWRRCFIMDRPPILDVSGPSGRAPSLLGVTFLLCTTRDILTWVHQIDVGCSLLSSATPVRKQRVI